MLVPANSPIPRNGSEQSLLRRIRIIEGLRRHLKQQYFGMCDIDADAVCQTLCRERMEYVIELHELNADYPIQGADYPIQGADL